MRLKIKLITPIYNTKKKDEKLDKNKQIRKQTTKNQENRELQILFLAGVVIIQ